MGGISSIERRIEDAGATVKFFSPAGPEDRAQFHPEKPPIQVAEEVFPECRSQGGKSSDSKAMAACKVTVFDDPDPMQPTGTEPDPQEYGRKIAQLRKLRGISQKELAVTSGVPLTAIRRCEQRGQIPLHRYLAITHALGTLVEITTTLPEKTKLEKIRLRKERSRLSDRRRLEQGRVTGAELQSQNSIIPRELADDAEWKKAGLAAAIQSLARPRSVLKRPPRTP